MTKKYGEKLFADLKMKQEALKTLTWACRGHVWPSLGAWAGPWALSPGPGLGPWPGPGPAQGPKFARAGPGPANFGPWAWPMAKASQDMAKASQDMAKASFGTHFQKYSKYNPKNFQKDS